MSTPKSYPGKDIREVWDFRLSHGTPMLFNSGETWRIKVFANDPHNEAWKDHPGKEIMPISAQDEARGLKPNIRVVLEDIETDIPTSTTTIEEGQALCYPYLRKVRDKYSRSGIEHRKPVVALINSAVAKLQQLQAEGKTAEAQAFLNEANTMIQAAQAEMRAKLEKSS